MTMMEIEQQIARAIDEIREKLKVSNETVVGSYLKKYETALAVLKSDVTDAEKKASLKTLLNCARGYLETSNNYDQAFLNEMGATESMIKRI